MIEENDESKYLDYTPLTNVMPIDMTEVIRVEQLKRSIKVAICVTCYSECKDEIRDTLRSVAANIEAIAEAGVLWHEVLVVIVFDGRAKMHASTQAYLQQELLLYHPHQMEDEVLGRPTTAHMFERTLDMAKHATRREYYPPIQAVLLVKQESSGKLSSHMQFFHGICTQINPKFTVLLDVGTLPEPTAIMKLYRCMEEQPDVAGCCGELTVRDWSILKGLQCAQVFEYAASHYMDKGMEGFFGFISVLPGAFSAYRWAAIRGEALNEYFLAEELTTRQLGPVRANMYLAEDRVLCFALLCRQNHSWKLAWVPTARASTDVPSDLSVLIRQRRRWLNGAFFATMYFLRHFDRVWSAPHPLIRKLVLLLQYVYILYSSTLSYLAIGNMFLTFQLIYQSALSMADFGKQVFTLAFNYAYACVVMAVLLLSLVGDTSRNASVFRLMMYLFSVMMLMCGVFGMFLFLYSDQNVYIGISAFITITGYVGSGALYGRGFQVAATMAQGVVLFPTFISIFQTYAFSHCHDLSWGTRGLDSKQQTQQVDSKQEETKLSYFIQMLVARQHIIAARRGGFAQHTDGTGSDERLLDGAGTTAASTPTQLNLSGDNSVASHMSGMTSAQQLELLRKAKALRTALRVARRTAAAKAKQTIEDEAIAKQELSDFRLGMLGAWLAANFLLVAGVNHFSLMNIFAYFIAGVVLASTVIKFFVSGLFITIARCRRWNRVHCARLCYRQDPHTGKLLCCARRSDYYLVDMVWEHEQQARLGKPAPKQVHVRADVVASPSQSPPSVQVLSSSEASPLPVKSVPPPAGTRSRRQSGLLSVHATSMGISSKDLELMGFVPTPSNAGAAPASNQSKRSGSRRHLRVQDHSPAFSKRSSAASIAKFAASPSTAMPGLSEAESAAASVAGKALSDYGSDSSSSDGDEIDLTGHLEDAHAAIDAVGARMQAD